MMRETNFRFIVPLRPKAPPSHTPVVVTATFIFSIIQCILVSLGLFSNSWWLGKSLYEVFSTKPIEDGYKSVYLLSDMIVMVPITAISYTFSVLLYKGITLRKAEYIKAYCIYGLVCTILGYAKIISLYAIVSVIAAEYGPPLYLSLLSVGATFYSIILFMVWTAHEIINAGETNESACQTAETTNLVKHIVIEKQ